MEVTQAVDAMAAFPLVYSKALDDNALQESPPKLSNARENFGTAAFRMCFTERQTTGGAGITSAN